METVDHERVKGCKKLRAAWMMHLRVAIEDVEAVAEDLLAPTRERRLGPVKHRELYDAAVSQLAWLLANTPPEPDENSRDSRQRASRIMELTDRWSAKRAEDVEKLEREEEAERDPAGGGGSPAL